MRTLEELGISPWPWIAWSSNEKRVKDSRGFAIADCDYENSEDAANARLIAAAPELYEALAALLHCAERESPFTDGSHMSMAMDMARKALAKAKRIVGAWDDKNYFDKEEDNAKL